MDYFEKERSGSLLFSRMEGFEEFNHTANLSFDLSSIDFSQLYNTSHFDKGHQIIFDLGEHLSLIGAYVLILILGLTFNGAIIWVILGKTFIFC